MKLNEITNEYLNKRLTLLTHNLDGLLLSSDGVCFYCRSEDGEVSFSVDIVDYCNNWNETMPLAINNEINIERQFNGLWLARRICVFSLEDDMFENKDKEPLRAIVASLIEKIEEELSW